MRRGRTSAASDRSAAGQNPHRHSDGSSSFLHSSVHGSCWTPFRNRCTVRDESPEFGEGKRTQWAEYEEGMAITPKEGVRKGNDE